MTDQIERPIKDRLYPCAYCGKKDKICVEARYWHGIDQPVKFYRIRCRRLICRFRTLFELYSNESCDLDGLIKQWNGCSSASEMGRNWRRIE